MHFISQTVSDGVSEQLFTLGDIPGVLWTPAGATGPRPPRPSTRRRTGTARR